MADAWFGLFGTGGCARSIMPFVRPALQSAGWAVADASIMFVDREAGPPVNDVPVISEADFLAHPAPRFFAIAIAEPQLRRRIALRAEAAGAQPQTLVAPGAQIFPSSQVGAGSILCPFTIITANATVGRHVHLNLFSYVEHDCAVADFVTFAPSVKCNGAVTIGEAAYIGAGAMIRQGTEQRNRQIGAEAVIGMGAVVLEDVAAGATVVGNPARSIRRARRA